MAYLTEIFDSSALFLLVFLVVHMGGNLTAFFGRDAYNTYGHHINSMPFIRVIELYLLVRLPRTTLSIILGPLYVYPCVPDEH